MNSQELLNDIHEWFEASLDAVFDDCKRDYVTSKAATYSLTCGGKRIRPALMYVVARMLEVDINDCLVFARSLEMIHTYSLIHDDLPSMDNDDLRRGKPTCHKVYGEDFAILAGDCLLNRSAELLLELITRKSCYSYAAYKLFTESGINGMIGGQDIDLSFTGKRIDKETLYDLHMLKTGALIRASILTPYYMSATSEVGELYELLSTVASSIGLIFQMQDDLLDFCSTSEILGKSVGKDLRDSKSTYVTIYGLDETRRLLDIQVASVKDSIERIACLGYNTSELQILVDYIVNRDR